MNQTVTQMVASYMKYLKPSQSLPQSEFKVLTSQIEEKKNKLIRALSL